MKSLGFADFIPHHWKGLGLVGYNHIQATLSMEFSRQEYWSGLPFPLPGNLGLANYTVNTFFLTDFGKLTET